MSDDDLKSVLERLGCTDSEIAVYEAVIGSGYARVPAVADEADVSIQHVYDVAASLEERGFLSVERTVKPITLRPVDPQELYQRHWDALSKLQSNVAMRGEGIDSVLFEDLESRLEEPLRVLGLDGAASDLVVAVIREGRSRVAEIAEAADLSRRYVYDLAEDLDDRGFLAFDREASPAKLSPADPERLARLYRERLNAAQTSIALRSNDISDRLENAKVPRDSASAVRDIQELVGAADSSVMLTLPASRFFAVADDLRAAVDRGVMVLLELAEHDDAISQIEQADLDGVASVVRVVPELTPVMVTVDDVRGSIYSHEIFAFEGVKRGAVEFESGTLSLIRPPFFLTVFWPRGEEIYTCEPAPLPVSYRSFRHTLLQAELHRQRGHDVRLQVETEDGEVHGGPLVEVGQSIVRPRSIKQLAQEQLIFDRGDDEHRITYWGTSGDIADVLRFTLQRCE